MKDFEILFKEGRFVNSDLINAKVWKIELEKYPKREFKADDLLIGFVVGVKVSKIAVVRNRLKRQMREVVRLLLRDKKIKNGFVISFMAKSEAIGKDYVEIEKSVNDILKKGRLLI